MTTTDEDPTVLERWTARASVLAVTVAILVSGIRGAVEGWYPLGDNALLTLRGRDVLTSHHPWLGTWTSASLSVGTAINNPGPLQFDLLAPFARLAPAAGVAIGVAVINVLAGVLAAAFARRSGGARLVAFTMVAAGGLAWSMGSELLFDPWQPHSLLLPFLALLVLTVAVAAGDLVALPWAVAVGSLIVQSHLSYAVLVPGILLAGLVWSAVRLGRWTPAAERGGLRRDWGRAVGVSVVVGLVCWAQTLWEQVARDGNLATVATNASGGDDTVGLRSGIRVAGSVIGDPTGWLRPSFADRFVPDLAGAAVVSEGDPLAGVRGLGAAALSIAAVVVLLAAAAWWGRRHGDRVGAAVAVVGGISVLLAVATAAALPVSKAFGIAPHQLRFLWPVAAVAAVLPIAVLAPRHRAVTVTAGVAAVVLAVATVPSMNAEAGPSADSAAQPVVDVVVDQIADWAVANQDRVVYFDGRSVPFAEPYSGPLLLELQRRDIDFEVDDDFSHQVGPRRLGPDRADSQVRIAIGDGATVPDGAERIAEADALTGAELERRSAIIDRLPALLDGATVRLNERGELARARGMLPATEDLGWERDAAVLIDGGVLRTLVSRGWVDPGALPPELVELARLEQRRARYSVAIWVEPLG